MSPGTSGRGDRIPLTAAQRGMWFAESLQRDYSVTVAHYLDIVDVDRPLDRDLFRRAVRDAARSLESAFTRIDLVDDVPMVVVDPDIDFDVTEMDLRAEPDPMAAAQAWMADDHRRPMDLLRDPIAISVLIRVADDRALWYLRGHHIAFDGYSALNSLHEAVHRYNAMSRGEEYVHPPRASLAEVAADDAAYADSSRRAGDRAYWVDRAADLPERVTLARRATSARLSPANVVASTRLTPHAQEALEAAAAQTSSSVATVLTAAFAAYLAAVTGTDDVVLSLPVTGRAAAKMKRASSMVSNMLPVRARDLGTISGRALIRDVQTELTGVLRHQRYRYEDIRGHAGLTDASAASFGPIVNLVFFDRPIAIDGARTEYQILSSGILDDLRVNLYSAGPGERLVVDLHGNPNLYSRSELDDHLTRLLVVVERLLADLDRPVRDVELLLPGERDAVLSLGRTDAASQHDRPIDTHLLAPFLHQVERTPDAPALETDDAVLTYRDVDDRRRALAALLVDSGVVPGDRVVIALDRGVDQVCAVYAVLGLGAVYVPVDPDEAADRRAAIAGIVAPRVIVDRAWTADASTSGRTPTDHARRVADRLVAVGPAYVIFTSGSTGTPKGVVVDHDAVLTRLRWMQDDHPVSTADAILHKTPTTFDVSIWELFWPLMTGARMVIARPGGHRDPRYLHDAMTRHGVTTVHFVPAMLDVYLDAEPALPASVRQVFTSGEALSVTAARRLLMGSSATLTNLYGPTEAAVDVTAHAVDAPADTVPIGRPVTGTDVYVLDPALRVVPVGVVGELHIAGRQLALGYVAAPDRTAERFVADPYGAPGDRMYRTGDLVRWNDSGELEYLGRGDHQVKIRGQRVELGEIESVLESVEGVDAATVVARTDLGPAPVLVAYLRGCALDEDDHRVMALARRRLPAHMVPGAVVVLDEFPVTSSGKVDRRALPEPTVRTGVEHAEARTETEIALAATIAELLCRERVGMRDNLFTLGADSLVAARLVSTMRSRHGLDLALTDVFDAATIGELAERTLRVTDAAPGANESEVAAVATRPAVLPLSPAQTRLWFINRMAPHEPTYNMPGALRLPGDTDADAIVAAVGDVLARHEILRTRFPSVDGEPTQEIAASTDAVAAVTADIGEVVTVAAHRLDHAIGEIVARGFDLTRELPVRARLLRVPAPSVVDHPGVADIATTISDESSSTAADLVVVLVVHHIAADGQSLPPLLADLMAAYTARRAHRAPEFAPLAWQYADVTLRARARLGDADHPTPAARAALEFWRAELDGAPEILTLPTDRPRPQIPSGNGDHVDAVIPAELATAVRDLARDLSVTPFAVVHSALAVVLGRLAGTEDVCIGTAVAGRDDPATAGLIGMFVNTVVLRSRIDPSVSIADHIAASHRTAARAIAHGDIPFERVVDAVAQRRGSAHPPLVGVALTMQVDPLAALAESGAIPLTAQSRVRAAKYDLTLTLTESADRRSDAAYRLEIAYATDLFDRTTAVELGRQLHRVLQTMVDAPTGPVGRIDLVAPDRIGALAAPPLVSPSPQPLRRLLATGARVADDDAPAVSGEITMAWSVFEAWTNQMARELIARGIGPGDVVAISIGRSAHSVAALVAVAKTGAAFVTIDPAHPPARRTQLVADSAAVLGLSVRAALAEAPGDDTVPWVAIDDVAFELALAGYSGTPVGDDEIRRPVHIDDLAYLLYTSGSTGRPKAAAITHAGLTAMVDGQRSIMGAHPGGRYLHVASPSFDVSVYEILMALCAGGELVISPPEVFAGDELTALLVRHRVTHAVVTPLVAATLDPAALTELTLMGFAGEKVPPELVETFDAPHRSLFNMYGPSEATIWTTVARLRPDAPVTIGRPVPGFAALVLDDWLRPVATGVIGELYLAGAGVGRGYHERPALTATRFVAHPFLAGARMYRTGDLVSRNRDGALVYHGRNDFQIKLRGMRIEPGEVDGVLRRHPGIDRAVSVGATTGHGDTVLVTYVTPRAGAVLVPEQIVEHARRHLPAHLVPHTVMVIDDLPRNRSGKVDRSALPPVELHSGHDFVAPRSELETIVAGVFASVVGVDQVGVHDDFFAIGGNSLSATKVISRLERLLDRRLALRVLFENPSVATLVGALGSDAPGSGASVAGDEAPLTTRRRSEVVPVSGAQRGMWLVNGADPTSGAHNISLSLHLAGALDVDALRAAVVDLVARHETLRTIYPLVGSEPAQVILPAELVASQFEVSVIDPSDGAADDSAGDVAVAELCAGGFDLTAELPVRAAVVRRETDDHELVFVVHHISADGVSLRPLGRDLVHAYLARRDGTPPRWPALSLQYADYASWHRERLAAPDADGVTRAQRQLDHWARRLRGAPGPVALPTDRPRPPVPTSSAAAVDLAIPADVVAALSTVARSTGTTLFMVVHAAYAVLLSRLSGRGDIVIGTPLHGRGDEALDDVVGMFVNTLALRTAVEPGERFTDLLGRVRADDLADMAHADVAFDDVVARVSGTGSGAGTHNPLFSVMLAFQNLEFPVVEVEGLRITPRVADTVSAKVDLELILFPTDPTGRTADGAMAGRMIYATDLFDAETVRRLVDRWVRLLADIASHPDRVVGDLVLEDAPTPEPVSEIGALPDLVAVASSVDPDAVAVDLDGTTVSFGEIDSMAAAMQITLPDGDAYTALTVALTTVVPVLGDGDVRILDEALDQLQSNARRVAGVAGTPAASGPPAQTQPSDGTGRE
ncbi:amino acid adenylation domain-containing protein [Williamsia sp. Leaf354]|uniref:amino acid adenylation domain-containing protein n=1 Tax=Williamsia sp. Leaf354 TaxID=1736349 RepID=UPI001F2FD330|nr:non-ribosomal peptide synthetase [Williamsia sp. Leaf354]